MKKIYFFLILSFFCFVSFAQNADSTWFVTNYTKMEQYITMRDGVRLFTSIYIPKDKNEKHPILMTRTPYSCAPYGENKFKDYWNSYKIEYCKEGYIMVTQDVRGRWMSEGEFKDVRPFNPNKKNKEIDEASDTYDAIDWLVKNIPDNNGKVGVFGISYPGFYSTMAAASNHAALKAVSPQAPVTNWFIGDDFHHKGVFFQMDAFDFYSALGFCFGVPHPKPISVAPPSIGYNIHDNYKFFLEAGTLKNLSKYMGDSIAFWKEVMSHPNYDAWWKARDARNATKNLKPAMLWVGGLFDAEDCWGAWNSYKAAEKNNPGKSFNKIIEGPWYHEQWANNDGTHHGNIQFGSNTSEYYHQHFEIPFFNYFLKGKGDISQIAEANVFITGANKWKTFSQWPPENKEDKAIYLQPGGKLNWSKPAAANSFSEYTSDPAKPVPYEEFVHFNRTRTYMSDDQRFAARRPDVLVFQTDTLTDDVTITGNVIADLQTSISTSDADFVVKVIDVFPDYLSYNNVDIYAEEDPVNPYPMGGYQMLVRAEIMRGKFRNSFEKPESFVPGKITDVKWELPDVAHTFLKGHRIMIQIQSSWFPLADRNPQKFMNIYNANDNDFQKATIRIFHDAINQSKIILPILKN
ncbi:CocE/NonD family hydrolase [Ginsengibacter hankyongi]|uniref:CocE/NonD family hydrolase n=1 Tax=Ginsengibacter hankyongi TaxID=2607284 RepID=A0A5J5ICZ4_9BACT|nr:CocE/NonD family hydrolase [Ginsengibacter hankyongi]KAA9037220.1 CocE/NonD family hydrolase [Ginsengibacter hankyongi]